MNINKCVKQMFKLSTQIKMLQSSYEKRRKYLLDKADKTLGTDFQVDDIIAKVSVSTRINYFHDKLKKRLTPEQFKAVVSKSVSIQDPDLLLKLLKKYVPIEEAKKAIKVERIINEQKLNDLFEIGEISLEDLSGCYEIVPSRTMVTVKQNKQTE